MIFVIFHGAFGTPEDNWFPELKEKLEALNQSVLAPQFPVDDWEDITNAGKLIPPKKQSLKSWIKIFESEVLPTINNKKLCFIGHSLGCLFILQVIEKFNIHLDSAIFVSPFMYKLNRLWQIDHVNSSFYKRDFDFEKIKKLIPISYVLYSDNDPYVKSEFSIQFAQAMNSSMIFVKKAGHMNSEINLNEFPLVLELCKTRLDLSLYQKYLEHRRELYSMEYVKQKPEAFIKLKPHEIIDEGVFHFKNLREGGFCTFLGWSPDWDPENRYYRDGRKAALRMKNFSRVFVINSPKELQNPLLIKQIRLDLQSGIKVYLCWYEDIKDRIEEQDFGIWDDDYLCTIKYTASWEKMSEIILDSRKSSMKKALEWKTIVLQKAKRIYNTEKDLQDFINKHK